MGNLIGLILIFAGTYLMLRAGAEKHWLLAAIGALVAFRGWYLLLGALG